MYTLAYVERAEREIGLLTSPRQRFRIERFKTRDTALERARAIIGLPSVSAVELHTVDGDVVLDARQLASEIGVKPRIHVAMPPETILTTIVPRSRRGRD